MVFEPSVQKTHQFKFLLVQVYVRRWLEAERIEVMDWAAYSPDLNPIENLWGIIVR